MRGRKLKPTALKRLQGNPGKRPLPRREPKPAPAAAIPAPSHLGKDARREWRRKLQELVPLGMVSKLDLGLLEVWCSAKADFIEAERHLRNGGAVTIDKDGNARRSPWTFIKSKAIEQMIRVAAEFGMSPASRPRVGRSDWPMPDEDAAGELDAYLASNPDRPTVQ